MRVSGYVWGVVLVVASGLVSLPSTYAVLFKSTADPTYNTTSPSGALANSGWQYEGAWGGFLGTPVAPRFFLAAKHVGGTTGDGFVLNGFTYHTTASFDDPDSDLRMWEVAETFATYALLYTNTNEVGKHCIIFGRGTQRGTPVFIDGVINGWKWGISDGVERWGDNYVATVVDGGAGFGDFLYATFDRGAGPNECQLSVGDSSGAMFIQNRGVWRLAGIHYAVDGPFSNAVNRTMFDAALLDRGGLYEANGGGWTFIPDTPQDNPSGFFSTRISSHFNWITSIINNTVVTPVASFSARPTNGVAPLAVTFTDTSSGTITNRFWSFGDGAITNTFSTNLVHVYQMPGTNTVSLIVTGPLGASTSTVTGCILVGFSPPEGTYNGLVLPTVPATPTSGFIIITVGGKNSISGRLTLGGLSYSFKGQLDDFGHATVLIPRSGITTLTLVLVVGQDTEQFVGTVTDGTFTSDLTADLAVFNTHSNPAPQAANYTLFLLGSTNEPASMVPPGNGYGWATVTKAGQVQFHGFLADGTKVTQNALLSCDGLWPLYVPLYQHQGSLAGTVIFTNRVGQSDLNGTLGWFKPIMLSAKFYSGGFTSEVILEGSVYSPPVSGLPLPALSNAVLTLSDGNLPTNVVKELIFRANGAGSVVDPGADKLSIRIQSKTGSFSGRFIHPTSGKSTIFNGVISQTSGIGTGFFLGTNQVGTVTLEPAE